MSLSLSVAPTNLESLESDVLVVGVYAGEESPRLALAGNRRRHQ